MTDRLRRGASFPLTSSDVGRPLTELLPGVEQRGPQAGDLPARRGQVRLQLRLPLPQPLHLALTRDVLPQQLQLVHLQPVHLVLVAIAASATPAVTATGSSSAIDGDGGHGTRNYILERMEFLIPEKKASNIIYFVT